MMKKIFLFTASLFLAVEVSAKQVTLTLYANGCEAANVITCPQGYPVYVTVMPDYGYFFDHWSDGDTLNPRTIEVSQDTTLTAQFARNSYSITTSVSQSDRGYTIGDTTVLYEETVPIQAIANYGYHFARWNDGNTDNPRTVEVTEDKTYQAIFELNRYQLTVSTNGHGSATGSGIYDHLSNVNISVSADFGYHFTQWSDGNTENPRNIVISQDSTFIAMFAKNSYTISTSVNDIMYGYTQGDSVALYQDTMTLIATPNKGYKFVRWSDKFWVCDDMGMCWWEYYTDSVRQVIIECDTTFTAIFEPLRYYVQTYGNNGHVENGGSHYYLSQVTLNAVPDKFYYFAKWSDGNTDNPRTFTITQDTTFVACFEKIRHGACGDNLTWNYSDGILVISGTGAMYDYSPGTAPWMPLFQDSIYSLVINNGCTSIGNFAFYGLSNKNFKTLELPNSIEKTGQYAFAECEYLKNVTLGVGLEKINAYAFNNDDRLLYVTCYEEEPPVLDETAFNNYDIYLQVPCVAKDEYKVAKGWKLFNKDNVSCISAETVVTTGVTVTPTETTAAIAWPTENQASTYTIEITKEGVVFCTLIFDADGRLTSIAFAPGRGMNAEAVAATATGTGFSFTVTGLQSGTHYDYSIDAKNSAAQSIKTHTGAFDTKSVTAVENVNDIDSQKSKVQSQKYLRNGVLLIERNGVYYNAQGAVVE